MPISAISPLPMAALHPTPVLHPLIAAESGSKEPIFKNLTFIIILFALFPVCFLIYVAYHCVLSF